MKKNTNENRPDFALMKLSGAISYFHMQMPRWLFCDPHYTDMSLEAKVAYTFLLNRYQLSRRNGWGKPAWRSVQSFTHAKIWRGRCRFPTARPSRVLRNWRTGSWSGSSGRGRGLPNRIFLAEVELDEKSCYTYDCAPFSPEPRPAEIALLDEDDDAATQADSGETQGSFPETKPDAASNTILRTAESAHQDMPEPHVLNWQSRTSEGAEPAYQDLQKPHTSKKDKSKKEYNNTDDKDPIVPRAGADDGARSHSGNFATMPAFPL